MAALPGQFTPLIFDVTDAEAVQAAAREVGAALNGATLSALINNAGKVLMSLSKSTPGSRPEANPQFLDRYLWSSSHCVIATAIRNNQ